jgi:four helix bundle protein
MFLQLAHTKLEVYNVTQSLTIEAYKVTRKFPVEEKFGMISQIRRAALSVHLNLAEGCSRKSQKERYRFFEIARGSVIEVDSALEIASELGYTSSEEIQQLGDNIIKAFKLLSGLIKSEETHH